jgi:cytochrome P450
MSIEPDVDLRSQAFHDDPAPVLAAMRARQPVAWVPSLSSWVLTRHADVARVVRDPGFSVDRGGSISRPAAELGAEARAELAWVSEQVLGWMVFCDPPRQTRLRTAIARAFTSAVVEKLRPAIQAITDRAIARVAAVGRLEVIGDVAVPVPALVTAQLLGLPSDDAGLLKRWTADLFDLFGAGVAGAEVIHRAWLGLREAHDYFGRELARRRAAGGDGMIAALATADGLDELDRIGLCVTLVAGAYETTTHVVGNGLWQLLRHPDQLAALRASPERLGNAVEEIFRFDGPAVSVVRRATTDVAIGDATVRAGDNLYCMLYAANRDPERYPEPDRFDVGRDDTRHLGLGLGIHFCLGAALSRLEAAIMLEALLGLGDLRLDPDADPPTYTPNLAIRGLRALPLCFTPAQRPLRST